MSASAQHVNPNDNIKFQQISEGLSQNTVTCMLQDQKGFMWFGTRNGLNKYDGVEFTIYQNVHSDSTSISDSHINCIFEDSNGEIWIGTWEGGLNRFNRDLDSFTNYRSSDKEGSISDNSVYAIFEDSNKTLWVGTENGGLNKFDKTTESFQHFMHDPNDEKSLSDNHVRVIFEDEFNNLWVGTYGGGLNRFDRSNNQFIAYKNNPNDDTSISGDIVWKYFYDSEGRHWLGTKKGLNLFLFDGHSPKFLSFQHDPINENTISHNTIMSLAEDAYGRLWIGTENGGLSIFDYTKNKFNNFFPDPLDPSSIGSNSIWSIFKDKTGTMWVGARNRGLNKWDKFQHKFNHNLIHPSGNNELSNKDVMCFLEDDLGNLWIGTDGGGLTYFDREENSYQHYIHDPNNEASLSSNSVISLIEDVRGDIWVGTWEGGLNRFDKKSKSFKRYQHDENDPKSLNTNNVFSMLSDSHGNFWVGVFYGGLDLYDASNDSFIHFSNDPSDPKSISHNRVFTMFEDSQQNIWIGTIGGGITVMHWDQENGPIYKHFKYDPNNENSLSSNIIHAINEDSRGNIWICTLDGLNKFSPDTNDFQRFGIEDGLPNNVIHGILEDNNGFLWISTNQGLSKLNPQSNIFRNYNVADGLQAQEFIRGSYMKSKNGELFFGGVNGYNSFFPQNVKDNPYLPPIYITGFTMNNELMKPQVEGSPLTTHIADTEEIRLDYDQNDFSIDFAALNYSQARKNHYAYILEGYDRDWNYVGTQRNAKYAKVPHGTYTFKVRGTNNDGLWNQNGAELKIVITPPWWDTVWAYGLYFLIALAFFLWYRHDLISRERLKSKLQYEHLELTKMQELDQMKSNFFANISHEFRTPLTLILSPAKAMYSGNFKGDFKKQYEVMIRNGERLLRLINQLLDLSKLGSGKIGLKVAKQDLAQFLKPVVASFNSYAERKSIKYNFHYPDEKIQLYFDSDKLEKIVTNLISNALKFTDTGYVNVTVRKINNPDSKQEETSDSNNQAEIIVEDSGIGVPEDAINSIFDRFYQVSNEHQNRHQGTGIGLSLTKELVELHNGTISIESKEGRGTKFTILLPLGKSHLSHAEFVSEETNKEQMGFNNIIPARVGENQELVDEAIDSINVPADQPTILIVEDNPDMRDYIKTTVNDNFLIIECENGRQGLDKAIETIPDLIISDVMMPEMDGVAMCKAIKSDQRICHIPLILLTAKTDVSHKITGLETGADDYITKPFDGRVLGARVNNLIESRKMLRTRYMSGGPIEVEPKELAYTSLDEVFIQNVLNIIEENMMNAEFRVEDLSKEVAMSRMHLYRKIKALTGQSIVEFIRTIRLKRAAQLLKQGQLSVAEITYDVGFSDLQYFRNCFKKQFGVSPSRYANKVMEGK